MNGLWLLQELWLWAHGHLVGLEENSLKNFARGTVCPVIHVMIIERFFFPWTTLNWPISNRVALKLDRLENGNFNKFSNSEEFFIWTKNVKKFNCVSTCKYIYIKMSPAENYFRKSRFY